MKKRKLRRVTAICLALGMTLMPMGQAFANEEAQTTEATSTVEWTDETEVGTQSETVTEPTVVTEPETAATISSEAETQVSSEEETVPATTETAQETETVEASETESSETEVWSTEVSETEEAEVSETQELETEETEEETTEEVIDQEEDVVSEKAFYSDFLTEEQREQVLEELNQIERPENYSAGYFNSQKECISYLKGQMSQRSTYVEVYFYSSTYYYSFAVNTMWDTIFDAAVEHTGVSYEGDAIYYDFNGANGSYERQSLSDGRYRYGFIYKLTYKNNAQQEQTLRTAIKNKTAELCNGVSSDYEKIRRIYDFICSTVSYDYAHSNSYLLKYTAYAAMMNHTSVCQGYATLFYRMCLEAGIDARVVMSEKINHSWDIVRLGNVYYYVDATWDEYASEKNVLKKNLSWFLKSSADFPDHGYDKEVMGSTPLSSYPISQSSYPVPKEDRIYVGLYPANGNWYYVEGEYIISITDLVLYNGKWYYVQDGVLNWNYTGLAKHGGGWYYVKNGCVDWTYTGLTQYYGTWYYVQKGMLNRGYTGLTQYNGTWYYVQNGVLTWKYYGLAQYGGSWYYVEKSCINWKYTGLAQHNGDWYYVQSGCVNWKYTGLTKYYGTWYYVQNGYLNKGYNGLAKYNGTWYYIQNGSLNWNYTGLTYYIDCWYYIQSGTLTFKYTGITNYYGTMYFVRNSTVAWNYNGTFTQNGRHYVVRNGRVVNYY